MTLLHPYWLIAAAALLILAIVWHRAPGGGGWARVMTTPVLNFLRGENNHSRQSISYVLLISAITALALSSPSTRRTDASTFQHQTGWVVLADVSRSMTLDDTRPSRLAAMREILLQLSAESGARTIALIIYSGDAFLASPPAFDKFLFNEHAALLEHGVIPMEGSNLARALSLATSVVTESGFVAARIFILGDSGGVGRASTAAAAHLEKLGHSVDLILFGDTAESTSANNSGETSLNLADSQKLARAGNGGVYRADALGNVELSALTLDANANPDQNSGLQAAYWQNQSHWLLLLTVPLLLSMFRRNSA